MSMVSGSRGPDNVPTSDKIDTSKKSMSKEAEAMQKTTREANKAAKKAKIQPATEEDRDLALQFLQHARDAMKRIGAGTTERLSKMFQGVHTFVRIEDSEKFPGVKFKIVSETPYRNSLGEEIVNNVTAKDIRLLANYERHYQQLQQKDKNEAVQKKQIEVQKELDALKKEASGLKPVTYERIPFSGHHFDIDDHIKDTTNVMISGPNKGKFLVRFSGFDLDKEVIFCEKDTGAYRQHILRFDPITKTYYVRPRQHEIFSARGQRKLEKPTGCTSIEQYLAKLEKEGKIDRKKGFTPQEFAKTSKEIKQNPATPQSINYTLYEGDKKPKDVSQIKHGKGPDNFKGAFFVRAGFSPKLHGLPMEILSYIDKKTGEFREIYMFVAHGVVMAAPSDKFMEEDMSPEKFKTIGEFLANFQDIDPSREIHP